MLTPLDDDSLNRGHFVASSGVLTYTATTLTEIYGISNMTILTSDLYNGNVCDIDGVRIDGNKLYLDVSNATNSFLTASRYKLTVFGR